MDTPQSKTSQAVAAYEAGDYKTALKIASTFRIGVSKQQSNILKKGYECYVWPEQYRQMKQDPEKCAQEAIDLFKDLFMKEHA